MTWRTVVEILQREMDAATANRVEKAMVLQLGGQRISIPGRADKPTLTDATVQAALRSAGWKIDAAAAALGVHPRTVYRHLQSKRKQTQTAPCGTYQGRLVR